MSALAVDRDGIAKFVNAVFRNVSLGSTVSLRAFQNREGGVPSRSHW